MQKVSLSLVGSEPDLTKDQARAALAWLYSKPESHFAPHCEHLFDLKKPFMLLAKVDKSVAAQHQSRLSEIGIQTSLSEVVDNSGLSLVPIEEEAQADEECPACSAPTSDPDTCSACGVLIKKFLEQKFLDEKLQQKIQSAGKADERLQQMRAAQNEEDKRRKEQAKRKKQEAKEQQVEPVPPEDDHFTIRTEDTKNNKLIAIVGIAIIGLVSGGLFTAHHLKNRWNAEDQYDFSVTEQVQSIDNTEVELAAARGMSEPNELVETGIFQVWNQKLRDIKRLTRSLQLLHSTEGMTSTMDELVNGKNDPFIQLVGQQQIAKLRLLDESAVVSDNTLKEKYIKLLRNNNILITALDSDTEQLYTTFNLGTVYGDLGYTDQQNSAYSIAEALAIKINTHAQPIQKLVAEVLIAEHFSSINNLEKSSKHYNSAIALVDQIDTEESDAQWAIPFIIRSQARSGHYADAYRLVDRISDPRIESIIADDITKYAEEPATDGHNEIGLSDIELEFTDDPAVQLLFENQRTMQENVKRAKELGKIVK